MEEKTIVLGGGLTIKDVAAVARGHVRVEFSEDYCTRVKRCRDAVDYFSKQGEAIYGLTTGLGDNCTKFIPEEDRIAIQRNNILAHTTSVGEPINGECTRAIMFVMLAHFGSGHTGIRLETLELLRDMLNKNVIPRVPGRGSIGYVTVEGHVGMVLIGEGEAWYNGTLLPGKEALHQAGLEPTVLSSKEGLTVISGTTSVTAFSALALYDAVTLVRTCDISAALTAEVLKANLMSTDPRVMEARPHPDQGKTAHNLRTILRGSPILAAYAGHRLQDALSVRSVPQLHGAVKKFIKDGVNVLNIELNSSVDNPLLFEEDGVPVALMASNADGSYPGMAADILSIAITDLAKMEVSRIDRMLNRLVSELPAFLNKSAAYNNGLMMIQYTAGGLLNELRVLAHPAVIDNVTSSACQEDYSNMGYTAAKKAYDSVYLAKYICAIELICGGQALDCYENLQPAPATKSVYQLLRRVVPTLENDAALTPFMEAVAQQIISGEYLAEVEKVTGPLSF